jgi:hypothetical protein
MRTHNKEKPMLIIRLIGEIILAPYTIVTQYLYIKNEAKSFETNPYKLYLYPVALAPVAFLIRLKRITFGQSL